MRYVICILLLSGCAATVPPVTCPPQLPPKVVDTGCLWAQPFQVASADTVATKKAALAAWTTYRKNCPSN